MLEYLDIRMISEESSDIEDWNNAVNSALPSHE